MNISAKIIPKLILHRRVELCNNFDKINNNRQKNLLISTLLGVTEGTRIHNAKSTNIIHY